ncbi:MAG: 50S ribosomal protein L19e [Candidatus Micrarchaeota archaeon]|nr:50S ribosomal protein L19e [Candidatus Micrarchaeota archaeon]
MGKDTIKRLAASILKVGISRVWLDPNNQKRFEEVLTREDVKKLIQEGLIKKLPPTPRRKIQKTKSSGYGSRKGTRKTRMKQKQMWMAKVRAQRKLLKKLLKEGKLQKSPMIKKVYRKIKANQFRSKKILLNYLKENNLLIEKTEK